MGIDKMAKLTDRQRDVVRVLQNNTGNWMTAKDIHAALCAEFDSYGSDSVHVGSLMRRLPEKDRHVEIDNSTQTTRYRWIDYVEGFGGNPDDYAFPAAADSTPDIGGDMNSAEYVKRTFTVKPSRITIAPTDDCSDDALIAKALMYYANGIVAQDPVKAIRAAFLAGQMGKKAAATALAPRTTPATSPRKSAHDVAPAVDLPARKVDEEDEARRIPAIMPDDMTYREMVDKIQAAYKACEFTYKDAAIRADLTEDYFMRIACGKIAQPTRAMQERVYAAIFEDVLANDDCIDY